MSRLEAETRTMTALWKLRPNDASAAWQAARPELLPTPDGTRWDVRLGEAWALQGRGAAAVRDALGDDFGGELTDAFDDLRLSLDAEAMLRAAGERRALGPPIYTAADLDAACRSASGTRYSLLAAGAAAVRTVRRLSLAARYADALTRARPTSLRGAVLCFEDVIGEGARANGIDLMTVRALAPIVPELIVTIRAVSR